MRGLGRSGRTRRSRRNRQAFQIQCNNQRFALNVIEIDVRRIRNPRRTTTIHARSLGRAKNRRLQPVTQPGHFLTGPIRKPAERNLRRLAQSHNAGHVFRSSPPLPLMPPAVEQRLQPSSLAHIQRPHSLRRVQLVTGNRQQVAANPVHIQRHLGRRLHGIRMEQDPGFRRNLANCLHRLEYAGFVVRHHHRDQLRIRTQRPPHIFPIDPTLAVHRNVRHRATHLFQPTRGKQNRVVLNGRRNHMVAGRNHAENGQVVGLRPATGKHNFRSATPHQLRHRFARALDRRARLLPMMVDGRRIPEMLGKIRLHGRPDFGQQRRRRVVIEVNPSHT